MVRDSKSSDLKSKILTARNLPTFPAIAAQVLEAVENEETTLETVADIVMQDPALAARILKTVNSSAFGLSKKCASIERALGLLGFGPVKSLVLSFSLLEITGEIAQQFDLSGFWRRAIFSATAARQFAQRVGVCSPDEAFTAALFQDIGMLAAFTVLEDRYAAVFEGDNLGHDWEFSRERELLGFTHAEIGSELAERWRLPEETIRAVGSHHTPSSANTCRELVRVVHVAYLTSEALAGGPEASKYLTRLSDRFAKWFGIDCGLDEILGGVKDAASELGKIFDQSLDSGPSVEELLEKAGDSLVREQVAREQEAKAGRQRELELERAANTDGLTGLLNRSAFDAMLADAFDNRDRGLAVLFCDGDRFKSINDELGHAAGDEVLRVLASRITAAAGKHARVFRYGGEEFVVLLPGADLAGAMATGRTICEAVRSKPIDLSKEDCAAEQHGVTLSVGVSAVNAGAPHRLESAAGLVKEADQAVYQAKANGRDRCVAWAPDSGSTQASDTDIASPQRAAALDSDEVTILLVEDDPLAATLLRTLLSKRADASVTWVATGRKALDWLAERPPNCMPTVIVTDYELPGTSGLELMRRVHALPGGEDVPVVVVTANGSRERVEACREAGAAICISKLDLCRDVNGWIGKILKADRVAA